MFKMSHYIESNLEFGLARKLPTAVSIMEVMYKISIPTLTFSPTIKSGYASAESCEAD